MGNTIDDDREFDDMSGGGKGRGLSEDQAEAQLRFSELQEELEDAREALKAKTAEFDKVYDQYVRLAAEFENLKKRTQKEKLDTAKYANEQILLDMLMTLDNLERALEHVDISDAASNSAVIEGVKMTVHVFRQTLEKHGVRPIESVGRPFDPAVHNAITQIESTEHEPGTVVSEFQKGYTIHDRLLRPAMVHVSKVPESRESAPEGNGHAADEDFAEEPEG